MAWRGGGQWGAQASPSSWGSGGGARPTAAGPTWGGAKGGAAQKGGAGKGAAGKGAGAASAPAGSYVVSTRGNDGEEVVVRTLVGEYLEHGSNHNRKVYKKVPEQGGEAVDVFMYYWDGRDGPAFEGWWFGNKLGGTQVWSHCQSASMTPPGTGWKIPWDGTVRPTLAVEPKGQGQPQAAATSMAIVAHDKVSMIANEVQEAGNVAKAALEQAKQAVGDYTYAEGIRTAEQLLQPQVALLNEALKKLMESQRGAVGEAAKKITQLGTQLRMTSQGISAELTKLRASKAKAEGMEKIRAAEEKDLIGWQEILPEATNKTNSAEDAVEKAVITSDMINAAGDDLEEVKQAVTATETAAQEAQKAIGEARIFLNQKLAISKRFESTKVKTLASTELGKLNQQLTDAQNKLNPLKSVRQDYMQRTAAQKVVQEILEKLSPAEVDVDRAEEATVMLSANASEDGTISKDAMKSAETAVAKASEHVAAVMTFIVQKKRTATGMAKDELTKMEERAKASQTRLQDLKNSHKEAAEKATCELLLKEAADKLQAVADTVGKAGEAEAPFLMGVEELPLDDTLAAVKTCEQASVAANTAVSIARMFIATKMVEAKRFTPGPSAEAQAKLKEYQTQLEGHTKKLSELKKATASRKRVATMREAEAEVNKAEELARMVGEVATVFQDDKKLFELSSDEIRSASEETLRAEQAANSALAEARKFITARQIEAKGKDMSTEVSQELIKYQTRLSSAQAEVAKSKKLCSGVETRLQAKKHIEEARAKVEAAQTKVANVVAMVDALGEEKPEGEKAEGEKTEKEGENPVKAAEKASAEAQVLLKTTARYLESKGRDPAMKEEVTKLQPEIKKAQEQLEATIATMQVKSEKITVDAIVKESGARVGECETVVQEVSDLEKPFTKSAEELPVEEASKALEKLEQAVQAAHTAVGGAKTFLAMKRLAAKRLTETSSKMATEELGSLQSRLDSAAKRLTDTKKGMAERKFATVKREVEAKVAEAEQKVAAAAEATKALSDVEEMAPEQMKSCCEKAGSAQTAANTDIQAARTLLLNRQKDAKVIASDSAILTELAKLLDKLQKAQTELDKQKGILRDQEHRFVAKRLLKDATDMLEQLEQKLKDTMEVAAPLASDKAEDFVVHVHMQHLVEAIRANMRKTEKTAEAVFDDLSEKKETVAEDRFLSFLGELPEVKGTGEEGLTEEQLKAAYGCMKGKEEQVTKQAFLEQFRARFLCSAVVSMTDSLKLKEGKTIRKLEVNEILEGLEEPVKDDTPNVNLMRVKARAEKDGKEGYITLVGNSGTKYLDTYSPFAACQKRIELRLKQLGESAKEVGKYIEQKGEELKSVRTGPLADTKNELLTMRPRVTKVKFEQEDLRKKVAEAEKKQKECIEAESRRRKDAADKKAATALLAEVEEKMTSCSQKVEEAIPAAHRLAVSKGAEEEDPVAAMDKADKELDAAMLVVEETMNKIKTSMDSIKAATKGPLSEARGTLVKQKVKVGALESKCKAQQTALQRARKQAAVDAHSAALAALQTHVRNKSLKADELFKELSKGAQEVSMEELKAFIGKIPDNGLKAAQLNLGLERYAAGMTRLTLLDLLQEFKRCVKDIAMTTAPEVKDSKTIRKLAAGEIVEVLESNKTDEGTGLARVRCRALADHKEGWATLRGNQGTAYMVKTGKPYYCCLEESALQSTFVSESGEQSEVKKLQQSEVCEVVEGPQKEPDLELQRVKIKAKKDGKTGWVTHPEPGGAEVLEPSKLLVCRQTIAITTHFDIAAGKAIRKLDAGETLEVLEGPQEDEKRSLTRIKAKTSLDGKEGWVTMKGNQGTAYTEESDRLRICRRSCAMEGSVAAGSGQIRVLEEGEVVEVVDGPKADTKEGASRVRLRSLTDSSTGWLTLTASNMQRWASQHKCVQSTVLNDKLEIKEAKTVRKLEGGELLEALDTPVHEKGAGVMRVRVRAEKDGAIGFATVSGNRGTQLLKPVLDE